LIVDPIDSVLDSPPRLASPTLTLPVGGGAPCPPGSRPVPFPKSRDGQGWASSPNSRPCSGTPAKWAWKVEAPMLVLLAREERSQASCANGSRPIKEDNIGFGRGSLLCLLRIPFRSEIDNLWDRLNHGFTKKSPSFAPSLSSRGRFWLRTRCRRERLREPQGSRGPLKVQGSALIAVDASTIPLQHALVCAPELSYLGRHATR
jgi:hypothetical protein